MTRLIYAAAGVLAIIGLIYWPRETGSFLLILAGAGFLIGWSQAEHENWPVFVGLGLLLAGWAVGIGG